MTRRTTAKTNIIQYETAECAACGKEVATEENPEDEFPDGINVAVGGGDRIETLLKNQPSSQMIFWWHSRRENADMTTQYLCPSCAAAIYDFEEV